MSKLSLFEDDKPLAAAHKRWFARKRRRRRGSRSVSGRSSDRRCCSVGASAANGTCLDFPIAAGTDSSGELFVNGGGEVNWASDVCEATRNSRREREGNGGGEREHLIVGYGQSGNFDGLGNESGYGSETVSQGIEVMWNLDMVMRLMRKRMIRDYCSGAKILEQFDCNGNLLHKISTKLSLSSYGEDELSNLIQSLYIKQPPLSSSDSEDESEWFEYKIKETNMFTVDKYQQIGFFAKENAFALRYQTVGMLETVIRQGVLGEDDTGEESPSINP